MLDQTPNRGSQTRAAQETLSWHRLSIGAIVACVVLVLFVLAYTAQVFLLVFAGVLLAISLRTISDLVSRYTPVAGGWSLALVVVLLLTVSGVGAWLLGEHIGTEVNGILQKLPESFQQVESSLKQHEWGRVILHQAGKSGSLASDIGAIVAQASGSVSTLLGAFAGLLVVLFIALYVAVEPGTYINGFMRLVPANNRDRARDLISAIGETLRWWIVGRVTAMVVVGGATALGLWFLGVQFPVSLGLLAAILGFVPYIGPLVAAIPAVLLALLTSQMQAVHVVLLYLGVQLLESYFLTPLVQKRAISLPPALTLTAQMLMGVLVGTLGVMLAAPLTATVLTVIKTLNGERSNTGRTS
jgi:predicted PurR-regulated permease PerM